jgi:hypothetical protein
VTLSLTAFWEEAESNSALGGPRGHLRERLGADSVAALERFGILNQTRLADRYPCEHPGGDGCPRFVIEGYDGSVEALCGNTPAECRDLHLSIEDIGFLALDLTALCEQVRNALSLKGKVEPVDREPHIHRVGSFIPSPGVKRPVYLALGYSAVRASDYIENFAQSGRSPCCILTPTHRYVGEELVSRMRRIGTTLKSLTECVRIDTGAGILGPTDPFQMFSSVGRVEPNQGPVARALIHERDRETRWEDVDEAGRKALLAVAAEFDLFADESARTVTNRRRQQARPSKYVPVSYFETIRACAEATAHFDPAVEGPHGQREDGKQTFQRAHVVFDAKTKGRHWAIFKTEERDGRAVYRYDPDPSISFCFLFAPKK